MKNQHVLIIEDEQNVLLGLKLNLMGLGFKVSCFQDGQTAYSEILEMEKKHIDLNLIITDIDLPGLDGIKLIDALLEHKIKIPSIVISGYSDIELRKKLVIREKFNFLQKPFSFPELKRHIENVLNYKILSGY
jgi:two-component system NtrC family response regulator